MKQSLLLWAGFSGLLASLLILCGCQSSNGSPVPTILTFATIEQNDWPATGKAYEERHPNLTVVTQADEIVTVKDWISEDAVEVLSALDYTNNFALLVFQGSKPSSGYWVTIENIIRSGETVEVRANFQEPKSDWAVATVLTSPYHVVQVAKPVDWIEPVSYKLLVPIGRK